MATAGFRIDLNFYISQITTKDVMRAAKENKLPAHFIRALREMTGMEVESRAGSLRMERTIIQMVQHPGGPQPHALSFSKSTARKIYDAVVREVHDLICSNNKQKKYKIDLNNVSHSVTALAGYLAREIAAKLGIGGSLLLAVILSLLMLLAKIGRNAFCVAFNRATPG